MRVSAHVGTIGIADAVAHEWFRIVAIYQQEIRSLAILDRQRSVKSARNLAFGEQLLDACWKAGVRRRQRL